jgi:hypothetical protein
MSDLLELSSNVKLSLERGFEESSSIIANMYQVFEANKVNADSWSKDPKPLLYYHYDDNSGNLQVSTTFKAFASSEMILNKLLTCWLAPSKILPILSSEMHDFKMLGVTNRFIYSSYTLFVSNNDWPQVSMMLSLVLNELEIGLLSFYHAKRILDLKALSFDHKNFMIQEALIKRLQKFPALYDYDLFSLMQRLFLLYSPTFCSFRTNSHLLETVLSLYLCRAKCRQTMMVSEGLNGNSRAVEVRVNRCQVQSPLGYACHLSIVASFSLLDAKEVFEKDHFLRAIATLVKGAQYVEGSFFSHKESEGRMAIFSIEVKSDEQDIALLRKTLLARKLREQLQYFIQTLVNPLFMPSNEEEVMKNIVQLSHEIKSSSDIPQMILNFESQDQGRLFYRAILVRAVGRNDHSMASQFLSTRKKIKITAQREKVLPFEGGASKKEIGVFRVELSSEGYLREDFSVDVFKAREAVCAFFRSVLGELRDFNGAMLSFELSAFNSFSRGLRRQGIVQKSLLEKFYYSVFPTQKRLVVEASVLQKLFSLYYEMLSNPTKKRYRKLENNCSSKTFVVTQYCNIKRASLVLHQIKKEDLDSLISFYIQSEDSLFIGAVFDEGHCDDFKTFVRVVESKISLDTRE